MRGKLKV